jgi:hypothetical protein
MQLQIIFTMCHKRQSHQQSHQSHQQSHFFKFGHKSQRNGLEWIGFLTVHIYFTFYGTSFM